MTEFLIFDDVSASYIGSIAALHGVSLIVHQGDFAALLGANGAGKTTLLKAASNLSPTESGRVTSGQIRFAGVDVTRHRPASNIREGLIPVLQGRRLFKSLTIDENLQTGAVGRGLGLRATQQGPKPHRKSTARLTSGGEQQMTVIGRGLMPRDRLVALDEPSFGVGASHRRGILWRAVAAEP